MSIAVSRYLRHAAIASSQSNYVATGTLNNAVKLAYSAGATPKVSKLVHSHTLCLLDQQLAAKGSGPHDNTGGTCRYVCDAESPVYGFKVIPAVAAHMLFGELYVAHRVLLSTPSVAMDATCDMWQRALDTGDIQWVQTPETEDATDAAAAGLRVMTAIWIPRNRKYVVAISRVAEHGDMFTYVHHKRRRFLSTSQIIVLVNTLNRAVAFLHNRGVCWADGKGENVVVSSPGPSGSGGDESSLLLPDTPTSPRPFAVHVIDLWSTTSPVVNVMFTQSAYIKTNMITACICQLDCGESATDTASMRRYVMRVLDMRQTMLPYTTVANDWFSCAFIVLSSFMPIRNRVFETAIQHWAETREADLCHPAAVADAPTVIVMTLVLWPIMAGDKGLRDAWRHMLSSFGPGMHDVWHAMCCGERHVVDVHSGAPTITTTEVGAGSKRTRRHHATIDVSATPIDMPVPLLMQPARRAEFVTTVLGITHDIGEKVAGWLDVVATAMHTLGETPKSMKVLKHVACLAVNRHH